MSTNALAFLYSSGWEDEFQVFLCCWACLLGHLSFTTTKSKGKCQMGPSLSSRCSFLVIISNGWFHVVVYEWNHARLWMMSYDKLSLIFSSSRLILSNHLVFYSAVWLRSQSCACMVQGSVVHIVYLMGHIGWDMLYTTTLEDPSLSIFFLFLF